MESIPFNLPDDGLTEFKGRIYLEQEFLIIEIEAALMGEFDRDKRMVKIEPSALKAVYVKRGFLKDKLCLRPKKDDLMDALPGKHLGEVQLRVWKTKRADLYRLAGAIEARMESADSA